MAHRYHVRVTAVGDDQDIPGRFGEGGLRELVRALGGTLDDAGDPWPALSSTFASMPPQVLAERLLDLVLLKPPIPAGCEALVRAMEDPETAPWRTHEVREDRVWLWYCHNLLHRALPDRYPPSSVRRVDLEVTALEPEARAPGRRTAAHDRTTFAARLLEARSAALHLWPDAGAAEAWAFDVLWGVEVGERRRPEPAEFVALGAEPSDAESGRLFQVALSTWLSDVHGGDLEVGDTWHAQA